MGRPVVCGSKNSPLLLRLDCGVMGRDPSKFDRLCTKLKVDEDEAVESKESKRPRTGIIIEDSIPSSLRDSTAVLLGEEFFNTLVERAPTTILLAPSIVKGRMLASWWLLPSLSPVRPLLLIMFCIVIMVIVILVFVSGDIAV